jgi:hypothetical protein
MWVDEGERSSMYMSYYWDQYNSKLYEYYDNFMWVRRFLARYLNPNGIEKKPLKYPHHIGIKEK